MLYPNRLQAALLFDRRVPDLEAIMRAYTRVEGMRSPISFNMPESNPGLFYRLYDAAEDLMVTLEYIERPCNPEVFRPALASSYTGILTPDIRDRIARTDTHILLEVSHGVLGGVEGDPKVAAMLEAAGHGPAGATQAQFERRLQVLALMARIAIEHAMPLAVHWTQSDLLLRGELFDALAAESGVPGAVNLHPQLFGPRAAPGEAERVGIRTFGARHWLGREILIEPNVLPWGANLQTIFAFLRVATMPNGYVIPDGDTFGPEDRSLSYRVLHHDAGARLGNGEIADMPLYELVPLKHVAHGFLAPEQVPDANVIDERAYPVDLMPADQDEKMALANEWAEKRKLAEGIGGRFELRHADAPAAPPPPPPPVIAPTPSQPGLPGLSGRGLRSKVFGRKGQ
ncbi:hypothetical protein CHX26_05650 [Porphyrobacter sp. HT-58-2]|uniref:hypothetical protein n=1 Tax=Porphyrobacter sp. HT-58-2 TaxID=2023229 RepID=UPI000CDCAE63|nr:hypothetical protein [Porphyrobacter sp. HT-58-2]AUX69053.1 hypothetical protein CHX26_05650 [Porphyrobacter sp. HT-58-2]